MVSKRSEPKAKSAAKVVGRKAVRTAKTTHSVTSAVRRTGKTRGREKGVKPSGRAARATSMSQTDGPVGDQLANVIDSVDDLNVSINDTPIHLDPNAMSALRDYVVELARGHVVRLVALSDQGRMMSSQQVADYLNVSRPYIVKLARNGQLPHTMTGNRHRFALVDVIDYEQGAKRDREDALRDLVPADGYDDSDF